MGDDNAQIVRSAYEVFNRDGPEAILAFLDPDVEWDESELPARNPGIYRGHTEVKRLFEENAALWEDIYVQADEILAGDEGVAAFIKVRGRGRHTGTAVELAIAEVWKLRSGKAWNVRLYLDRQEALEAAGLGN